jgi:hypothetical protein
METIALVLFLVAGRVLVADDTDLVAHAASNEPRTMARNGLLSPTSPPSSFVKSTTEDREEEREILPVRGFLQICRSFGAVHWRDEPFEMVSVS